MEATKELPNYDEIRRQGIEALSIHRQNYDEFDPKPKTLQLLWWEFPPEHLEELQEGCHMNFLTPPPEMIHQNANMDEKQLKIGADFVDELVSLGVLRLPKDAQDIVLNAPLFVVTKPGEPGQCWCIADMLQGGQNQCVGSDPVYLPPAEHILDQMYTDGWSAVLNLSKYFYNFSTHPDDRPYLGTLHPILQILLEYWGLPMGSGNSPAVACRVGQGFMRLIREEFEIFQGAVRDNCWWTGFKSTGEYCPVKGYGYILEGPNGLAVKIWGFVDDFLLHDGPSRKSVEHAMLFFLEAACRVGLMCHPKKCTPPNQSVRYIGFIFDTHRAPCLRIPLHKREHAVAIVGYLISSPNDQSFSRLSLAVAVGILQSLVEATPSHLGNTYLRSFHSVVRPPGLGSGAEPYYTKATIPFKLRQDLRWRGQFLIKGEGRFCRTRRSATLVPNWGDGSGTGTGGTLGMPDEPLKMWHLKGHLFGYGGILWSRAHNFCALV
jgi:hypothetical protein